MDYLPTDGRESGHAEHFAVSGLRRAQLSFAQVLGQSVSAVAPSAVMVTLPALVIPAAGRSPLVVFVVTALLMAAVGYCIGQFSTRMVAVSGLYSYTVEGLGPVPGIVAGWSAVIGYAAAAMASTLGAASYLAALLGRLGVPDGRPTIACLAVLVGAAALMLMIRGIRLSARISLTIEVFAIAVAAAVLVIAFTGSVVGVANREPLARSHTRRSDSPCCWRSRRSSDSRARAPWPVRPAIRSSASRGPSDGRRWRWECSMFRRGHAGARNRKHGNRFHADRADAARTRPEQPRRLCPS